MTGSDDDQTSAKRNEYY